eukprot:5343906-Lingulodinium_polyedra.AAC.1
MDMESSLCPLRIGESRAHLAQETGDAMPNIRPKSLGRRLEKQLLLNGDRFRDAPDMVESQSC